MVKNKAQMVFALVVGIIYLAFGLMQVAVAFGIGADSIGAALLIPQDFLGGFVLVVIGAVFLVGVNQLRAGVSDGLAFVYIGILLSLTFAVIYLLVMLGDSLMAYLIVSEDFEGWGPVDDLKPGIYLAILSLLGLIAWRDRFSLKRLSKAGA